MKPTSLSRFVDDVRGIVRKYMTEAALSVNNVHYNERWDILHTRVQNRTWLYQKRLFLLQKRDERAWRL